MARSEVAHALRDGTVPGKSLWAGDAVSFSVEPGFGAAARISGARRESGTSG